jgi:hypothetical protein
MLAAWASSAQDCPRYARLALRDLGLCTTLLAGVLTCEDGSAASMIAARAGHRRLVRIALEISHERKSLPPGPVVCQ